MCVPDWSVRLPSPCSCLCNILLPGSDRHNCALSPSCSHPSRAHLQKMLFQTVDLVSHLAIHPCCFFLQSIQSQVLLFSSRHPVFCPTSLTCFSEPYQETDRLMVPVCTTCPRSFKLLRFYVWKVNQKVVPYKLPQ